MTAVRKKKIAVHFLHGSPRGFLLAGPHDKSVVSPTHGGTDAADDLPWAHLAQLRGSGKCRVALLQTI